MKKLKFKKLIHRQLYLLLCVMLFAPVDLVAQELSSGEGIEISYGVKLGTTFNQFSRHQPHTSMSMGLTGGLYATYAITPELGVQIEANYLENGGKLVTFDMPNLVSKESWYDMKVQNHNVVIRTLDIPLLAKYSYEVSGAKLSALFGASLGWNIKSGYDSEITTFTEVDQFHTYKGEQDVTDIIEKLGYSLTGGVSFEIPVSSYSLSLEARYRYGLNPVFKGYSYLGIPQVQGNMYSNSFTITLGIGI